ncbi:hypothetical protein EDC04DRAFT_2603150 [Pisolithus marmoratus]|nr:hypothetical protein EDC04DRAFT_2603150 [Pisolithus marmoratus]
MGLVQSRSHFTGVLVAPVKCPGDKVPAQEASPTPCDLARVQDQDFALSPLPKTSHTTLLVKVTWKRKFFEDQHSAPGLPIKISCHTSLVMQMSSQPFPPIARVIPSSKSKVSEDQDLVLGPPTKMPCIASLVDLMNPSPRGNSCFIW